MSRAKHTNKLYSIESLRFLFAVIIVYFHILHNNIIEATGGTVYLNRLADNCNYAGAIVDCFFILGGYFMYKSFCKNPDLSVKQFSYRKFSRLWPVLFVSTVLCLLFFDYKFYPNFFDILFLQNIGVSLDYQGINWYVSPFFWVIIFYYVLLKHSKNKRILNIIVGVTVYFSYVILVNNRAPNFGREAIGYALNAGVLRALGGIGLGYLIAVCCESVKSMPFIKNFKASAFQNILITFIVTVLEAGSIVMMSIHFFARSKAYANEFIVVILFTALFVCFLSGKGLISKIFSFKLFANFGKYAYSIYIMQSVSFNILARTLWKTSYATEHSLKCILLSVAFAVALGIATYYIVEKPSAKLLKKFERKLFAREA